MILYADFDKISLLWFCYLRKEYLIYFLETDQPQATHFPHQQSKFGMSVSFECTNHVPCFFHAASEDASNVFTSNKFSKFQKVGFLTESEQKMVRFSSIYDIKINQLIISKLVCYRSAQRTFLQSNFSCYYAPEILSA